MWTRKELKGRAKKAFQLNYWKTVLVALLMAFLIGGGSSAASGFSSSAASGVISRSQHNAVEAQNGGFELPSEDDDIDWSFDFNAGALPSEVGGNEVIGSSDESTGIAILGLGVIAFVGVILVIAIAVSLAISILLIQPLTVGAQRFFVKNLGEKAQLRELLYAFDHSYLNTVKVMFFKGLYEFLWSLLLIVPGIVKSYEYRMIPYLLAEHPEMSREEAFARSKEMMNGNKWKAFVLDLSFIPWNLLSLITLDIVGLFYAHPYIYETNAALYETLKHELYGNEYLEANEAVPANDGALQ